MLLGQGNPGCPLCGSAASDHLAIIRDRQYAGCRRCRLRFLEPSQLPSRAEEKAHYDTHENSPNSPSYRRFLTKLTTPLIPLLRPGSEGLDYGAGPGPTLSVMLEEQGFIVDNYDPIYQPNPEALLRQYDFITSTEVVEHFHHPASQFTRIYDLLKPGGWFGGMTEIFDPSTVFADWWYHRDPTHVSFFELETMRWIAERFGMSWRNPAPNVVIFQKSG